MRGHEYETLDRDGAFLTQASDRSGHESDAADAALAQEAHALISLFLDIEDAQARRRCIDYVRREAGGASRDGVA